MKTIKRIIAVLLLIVVILGIGYLSFTGSQIMDATEQQTAATEVTYEQKTDTY